MAHKFQEPKTPLVMHVMLRKCAHESRFSAVEAMENLEIRARVLEIRVTSETSDTNIGRFMTKYDRFKADLPMIKFRVPSQVRWGRQAN